MRKMIEILFSTRKDLPLVAGFSTAADFGQLSKKEVWSEDDKSVAREMFVSQVTGKKKSAYLNQVHGNVMHYVTRPGLVSTDGDAIRTDTIGVPLSLQVADCVPLLFYLNDYDKPAVGLVHVGWRGAQLRIVQSSIQQRKDKGYDISRMYVWIGPSICSNCYEFGDEALEIFGEEHCMISQGKTYFDLRSYVMAQLRQTGFINTHIRFHGSCNMEDDRFFSYRKDPKSGKRMFGVIMMKDK